MEVGGEAFGEEENEDVLFTSAVFDKRQVRGSETALTEIVVEEKSAIGLRDLLRGFNICTDGEDGGEPSIFQRRTQDR